MRALLGFWEETANFCRRHAGAGDRLREMLRLLQLFIASGGRPHVLICRLGLEMRMSCVKLKGGTAEVIAARTAPVLHCSLAQETTGGINTIVDPLAGAAR